MLAPSTYPMSVLPSRPSRPTVRLPDRSTDRPIGRPIDRAADRRPVPSTARLALRARPARSCARATRPRPAR